MRYKDLFKPPVPLDPNARTINSTSTPNTNTLDFRRCPINRTIRIHKEWECLAVNDNHELTIGINNLHAGDWNSTFWGYDQVDVLTEETSCFRKQNEHLLSGIKYMSENNLLCAAYWSGDVEVWSTHERVLNPDSPYSLFKVGEGTHEGNIIAMDTFKRDSNKAVTACYDGKIKIWEYKSYLTLITTFAEAHFEAIQDIEFSSKDPCLFASCSYDKSVLLWDDRMSKPATALFTDHQFKFSSLSWAPLEVNAEEMIVFAGDELGFIHALDRRQPKQFLQSERYFDRRIRKIAPNGKRLAVAASNELKVCNSVDHHVILHDSSFGSYVTDLHWNTPNELWSIGYAGKLEKLSITDKDT